MSSLSELRAIEQQRIADERATVREAEAARLAAIEAAARAQREAEEAKLQAAHDAALALEHARVAAEREARLRLEAAQAAELARQQVALAETRMVQELELRRAEVAKKRPTWMVVVTAVALVAAGFLVWFAVESQHASQQAADDRAQAELEKKQAVARATEAQQRLATIDGELAELSVRVDRAVKAVEDARTAADREVAAVNLQKERERQAELRRIAKKTQDELDHQIRIKPVVISKECLENALAPGCGK